MNTPLQQAVKNLIDRWNSPIDWPEHIALRKALDAELQQTQEPTAYINVTERCLEWAVPMDWRAVSTVVEYPKMPLYLHPPQQAVPSGERPEQAQPVEPVAFRKANQDGFYRYYETDETQPELCEPLYLHPPQQAVATPLHKLIEGMTVSIDVSTGEHDAGNRLFGVVNEVMESSGDKNGLTLLVYETTPNFKPPQQAVPSGERAELIAECRAYAEQGMSSAAIKLARRAADMLEADAQQATPYGWMVSGVPTVMRGSLAQEIQEQEAKRIGGDCKAFPVYTKPQQAEQVPMTEEEITNWYTSENGLEECNMSYYPDFEKVVRAVEKRCGSGGGA